MTKFTYSVLALNLRLFDKRGFLIITIYFLFTTFFLRVFNNRRTYVYHNIPFPTVFHYDGYSL